MSLIRPDSFFALLLLACFFYIPVYTLADSRADTLPSPYSIIEKGVKENNYLGSFLELLEKEAAYLASPKWKRDYYDYVVLSASYVGDYDALYKYEEKFLEGLEPLIQQRRKFARNLSSSPLDTLHPLDALEAIGSVAGNHTVVMINEEHRTPVHRALTLQLLPVLYAKGFRYFAVETVNSTDKELNERGYPVKGSGTYSNEPVFGDAIRTALKLGYRIIPYEIEEPCTPKPDDPMYCSNMRERGQAQNLFDRTLRSDPKAKVLVHVGRGHNSKEGPSEGFAFMAWHFREISQIDPFTVDQESMSERRNPSDEHPLYRYVTSKWRMKEPTVFQSEDMKLYSQKEGYDLTVFTPRAQYERGRPTWLKLGKLRKACEFDVKRLNIPARAGRMTGKESLLVQAFNSRESAEAVPVDQIILHPAQQIPILMLPKGKVRIRAIDRAGSVTGQYEIEVK